MVGLQKNRNKENFPAQTFLGFAEQGGDLLFTRSPNPSPEPTFLPNPVLSGTQCPDQTRARKEQLARFEDFCLKIAPIKARTWC